MRRIVFLVLCAMAVFSSCADDSPQSRIPLNYGEWPSTVDGVLDYEIPGHTVDVRKIYINETGTRVDTRVIGGRLTYEYPEGTVIVKENFTTAADETARSLTVMIKDPMDPDARGGWLWINRDVASGKERIFTNEFCFSCHQNANEKHPYGDKNSSAEFRDYVYFPWKVETGS